MAVVLIMLCSISFFVSAIGMVKIGEKWGGPPVNTESYFDTGIFQYRFNELLDVVINITMKYKSEGNIEDGNAVDKEELIQNFKEHYNIIDGTITDSTRINDNYNGLILLKPIPENLQDNYIEYDELVRTKLPQYRKIFIQGQLADFRNQKEMLSKYNNFRYYVEDENGHAIGGNINSSDYITQLQRNVLIQGSFISDKIGINNRYQNSYIADSNSKLYVGIEDNLAPGDVFFSENIEFETAKDLTPIFMGIMMGSCVIAVLLLLYLIRVSGQNEKGSEITFHSVDRIYNDIHVILVLFAFFASFFAAAMFINSIFFDDFWAYFAVTILGILFVADTGILLSFVLSMSRQMKAKQLFHNTLVSTMIRKIGILFSGKTFRGWMVLLMLGYGAGNGILAVGMFILLGDWEYGLFFFFLFLFTAFNIMAIFLFVRALSSLTKIMIAAKETGKGNLNNKIDLSKISPSFTNFAKDIAGIQSGLKDAVEEAVKGERMKAELITNVSHDLKTPLTSIVTYVDLLKKENLGNERAEGFVSVLDEKSARLKQLIEDLIEASKASSGNLAVVKQKVDLRQLVIQASGELEEKIEKAGLNFRVNCDKETVVCADGRHMWRIVENLLSNAIKYSMPNSRVYIDILKSDTMGVLVIKNISELPIEVTAEQLTERFVRGDESRTTEGSGLGLSIAKSLTSLQGGTFHINIDGDLFKATIKMPLWTQEDEQEVERKVESIDENNINQMDTSAKQVTL